MTDRGLWVAGLFPGGNVRRLMYQPLIWAFRLRNDARSLGPPLDTEEGEGLANALINGVRRDVELGRDFLGAQMLIDEQQAIELPGRQASDARRHYVRLADIIRSTRRIMRVV